LALENAKSFPECFAEKAVRWRAHDRIHRPKGTAQPPRKLPRRLKGRPGIFNEYIE